MSIAETSTMENKIKIMLIFSWGDETKIKRMNSQEIKGVAAIRQIGTFFHMLKNKVKIII